MKMTLAEKLRFLADRIEDGKEFRFVGQTYIRYFDEHGQQFVKTQNGKDLKQGIRLKTIRANELEFIPKWEFTEDEKAILRNLPSNYRFIARDRNETLFIYDKKPYKGNGEFCVKRECEIKPLSLYEHLFKSVQWSDDEPCEFRRYL